MLSPEYVAGLFDGEGTVSIVYSKIRRWKRDPSKYVYGFKIVAGLSSTFHPVLDLLKQQFSGDINISSPRKESNHKAVGAWKITGHQRIQDFLKTIEPHCIIKKRQVGLGLAYLDTGGKSGQRITPELWQRRIDVFNELRGLNRRGTLRPLPNSIPANPATGWNPKRRNYSDEELAEMMNHVRSFQSRITPTT
ncbi:MAG TPA: hypothetical protein VIY48_19880 [Candidatus Paceibacterota bacterium]